MILGRGLGGGGGGGGGYMWYWRDKEGKECNSGSLHFPVYLQSCAM